MAVVCGGSNELERIGNWKSFCAVRESIKKAVAVAVVTALKAFPPTQAVKVYAQGSQSDTGAGILNQLSVGIEPIHGWQE